MINILLFDAINIGEWKELYQVSSFSSFFQSPECYQFYSQLSFMTPFVYGVADDGQLKGLVCGYIIYEGGRAKRFFSKRAIIPGGALLANDISNEALELLLTKLKTELQHKAIYVEFRNFHDYGAYKSVFERIGFTYQEHLNFQIDLTTVDEVFAKLSDTKKRQVKQTLKVGVSFELTQVSEDITDFYKILSELYKNKIKLPLFPLEFFEKIIQDSMGQLIVIKEKDVVLGGILCVLDKKTVFEWFVCGLDNKNQNIYPSALATWAGIEHAVNLGCKRFDFMGAGKPNKEYGVRDFKARFGGKLVEHGRFLYVYKPNLYSFSKNILNLIKKLPFK